MENIASSRRINYNAPRIERKDREKNRRTDMKILCSHLLSLLPDYTSKRSSTLADNIGHAAEYIESMKLKLENMKQKKESLSRRKRTQPSSTSNNGSPLLEVQEMGPNLDLVIANELVDGYSMFHGLIRLLHLHRFEVANANFSIYGNSTVQILHDHNKVGDSKLSATMMSRKMKEMICESSNRVILEPQ
ncbi:transcription factor bHLH162-like isoform X2 [Henckelia pumila]|uniref:transcription factor bHLH162-like isoform X2 n=1 Tax=Henckelia pumila TaxID=405737 RepID=UPI003C6E61C2